VHNFDTTKGMDELQLLQSLPRRLRQDVQYYLNRELITSLPLLHGMDDRIVLSISDKLRREVYMPGDAIVKQGDVGDDMYFISSGECECTAYGRGVVSVKQAGMFFGEVALFSSGTRTATVTARTLCELMVLTKSDLDLVADIFSELKASIELVAAEYAKRPAATPEDSLSKAMSRASFFSMDAFMTSSGSYDRARGVRSPEPSAADGMVRGASSWDLMQQHAASASDSSHDFVEPSKANAGGSLLIHANGGSTHSARPTDVDSRTPTLRVETKAVAPTGLQP
jgi:CRP-like cAMP-binding protein